MIGSTSLTQVIGTVLRRKPRRRLCASWYYVQARRPPHNHELAEAIFLPLPQPSRMERPGGFRKLFPSNNLSIVSTSFDQTSECIIIAVSSYVVEFFVVKVF